MRPPSPLRGGWLAATLVILALVALFLRLGTWQLARRAERRAANARLMMRLEEPPLQINGSVPDVDAADLRRAIVAGTYDFDQEVVLRNRTYNELPGVHVIVPLRIAGSDTAILVDRGWIPYELADPEARRQFRDATGETVVQGILQRSQVRSSSVSPSDPPLKPDLPRLDAWHRVDIPRIQEQVPYPLLPLYLEEESPAGGAVRRFPRPAPEIALSEGSHLFYASQWFAFAIVAAGGYAALYYSRTRRK